MSIQFINQYYAMVDKLKQYGGKDNEAVISQTFGVLINGYCEKRHLMLVPQVEIKTKEGKLVRPDGTVKNALRLDYGYWESKANVDLEEEIRKKFNAGYPRTNILFEDSRTAILYQQGEEIARASIRDAAALDRLLNAFPEGEAQGRQGNRQDHSRRADDPGRSAAHCLGIPARQSFGPGVGA